MNSILRDEIAQKLWNEADQQGTWLSITHIQGKQNTRADHASRIFDDTTEWSLPHSLFDKLSKIFPTPQRDLFASRLNAKLKCYVSWGPDPYCEAVDAFTVNWGTDLNYCFPPFNIIHICLQKLRTDSTTALTVVPLWPNQPWFSSMLEMLIAPPVLLPLEPRLILPWNPSIVHPLENGIKFLEKSWKNPGILWLQKSGNPVCLYGLFCKEDFLPNLDEGFSCFSDCILDVSHGLISISCISRNA